jgi:hypothetical protein
MTASCTAEGFTLISMRLSQAMMLLSKAAGVGSDGKQAGSSNQVTQKRTTNSVNICVSCSERQRALHD